MECPPLANLLSFLDRLLYSSNHSPHLDFKEDSTDQDGSR
jgi:hypothetical protein